MLRFHHYQFLINYYPAISHININYKRYLLWQDNINKEISGGTHACILYFFRNLTAHLTNNKLYNLKELIDGRLGFQRKRNIMHACHEISFIKELLLVHFLQIKYNNKNNLWWTSTNSFT